MLITTKLIVVFLTISIIPLFIFASLIFLQIEQHIKNETLNNLDTIASIQKNRVQNMLDQNVERLVMFTNRVQLKIELDQYNKKNSTQSQQFINNLLETAKSEIKSFKGISILDTNGKVVASTDKAEIGSNRSNEEFFLNGLEHNEVTVIFKDKENPPNIREYLAGPLTLDGKTIGVAAIESDAASSFFNASQNYEGLGQTGEFYVAKKDKNGDAVLISSLRFVSDATLNYKVSRSEVHTPIIQSTILKRENIITDSLDYRGEPVLAATRYLESPEWGLVIKIDKKEAFATLDNLRYLIIITVTIISILIIAASLVIGKSISKPIINLRNAAKEIADGNLDINLKEINNLNPHEDKGKGKKDEITDLAFQFDKMRQNITYANTNLHELVHQKTKDLEKAIEDLREKERHLTESNEKLRLLDKLKNDFINIAAHELRTPTQAILAFADLLTIYPDKKVVIETIQRNARRLKRLISDILDVTKIENQRLILKKETLDVANLVFSIVDEQREQIKKLAIAKKIEIYLDVPKEKDIFIFADRERMVQVISNLLDNSIKFIEKEGSIYLTAKIKRGDDDGMKEMNGGADHNRDQVIISIKDTGNSIPDDIFPILFTKFTTNSFTGSGLGLYISKSIIEAHGGRLWAENNRDEKGVTFTLSLPLSKKEKNNNNNNNICSEVNPNGK
jgi:signal transduction histidine kinase